ncbi:MAG: peptidoglycan-binding protein [Cyanobacteria bacterium P01_A01_bin.15]
MKRWCLHPISTLWLLTLVSGSMATTALATDSLSTTPLGDVSNLPPMLLAQGNDPLGPGSTGSAVKDIQSMLALMGYYGGPVDGTYEQMTSEAVRQFQTDAGLVADGVVGPLTWQRLLPTPATLAGAQESPETPPTAEPVAQEAVDAVDTSGENVGSQDGTTPPETGDAELSTAMPVLVLDDTGTAVSRLQGRLAELNFYDGPVDGIFGPQTEQAVEQFQRQAGLKVDGIVGPATWLALSQQ